jgi:hypothetical protein
MARQISMIPTTPISPKDLNKVFTIYLNFSGDEALGSVARFAYGKETFDDETSDPAGRSLVVHYDNLPENATPGDWTLELVMENDTIPSAKGQLVTVAKSA